PIKNIQFSCPESTNGCKRDLKFVINYPSYRPQKIAVEFDGELIFSECRNDDSPIRGRVERRRATSLVFTYMDINIRSNKHTIKIINRGNACASYVTSFRERNLRLADTVTQQNRRELFTVLNASAE
ncbi:MAG: hypothetical protein ACI9QD_000560, partial [Thermoproteota archaeon]